MKYIELQYAFELEIAKLDTTIEKVSSYDSIYWLNQGVNKFIKTRYNGNNPLQTSFEQNEKRSRDLMNLYSVYTPEDIIKTAKVGYDEYTVQYPADLLFVLDEAVEICPTGKPDEAIPTEIFECTLDSYMYRVTNSLTDFHYHNGYARPLRVRTKEGSRLLTDGQYDITKISLGYLRTPIQISMNTPFEEYTEFPEYTHHEIVKLAVQMFIENSLPQRYESIGNEVSQME